MAEINGELIKTPYHLFNRDDQILVWNPFSDDFDFRVEGQPYIVRAGDKAEMPGYMANMFVKNVVDEMMQKDKKLPQLTNETERQKYVDKVVINVRKALAPVKPDETGEARVLSYEKKGELANATFAAGREHELPLQRSEASTLTSEQLDRMHPVDDGKGNRLQPEDEEEFPTLVEKTRAELMKEARERGITTENTDTKETLLAKLAA